MRLVVHVITCLILSFIGLIELIGLYRKNNENLILDKQIYVSSGKARAYSWQDTS